MMMLVLSKLVPGSDDYFYYTVLNLLNENQDGSLNGQIESTIKSYVFRNPYLAIPYLITDDCYPNCRWEDAFRYGTPRLAELKNRYQFIKYDHLSTNENTNNNNNDPKKNQAEKDKFFAWVTTQLSLHYGHYQVPL